MNFVSLEFIILKDFLHWFVKNFILISLLFDVSFKHFIIWSCFIMEFILDNLSFFDKYVHHHIDFFSDLVSFFFKQLKIIISSNEGILKIRKTLEIYKIQNLPRVIWFVDLQTLKRHRSWDLVKAFENQMEQDLQSWNFKCWCQHFQH